MYDCSIITGLVFFCVWLELCIYTVGVNLSIKIADFGLARGVCDKDYYRVAGHSFLPVRWMAPECLLYGIFSSASDVWCVSRSSVHVERDHS